MRCIGVLIGRIGIWFSERERERENEVIEGV